MSFVFYTAGLLIYCRYLNMLINQSDCAIWLMPIGNAYFIRNASSLLHSTHAHPHKWIKKNIVCIVTSIPLHSHRMFCVLQEETHSHAFTTNNNNHLTNSSSHSITLARQSYCDLRLNVCVSFCHYPIVWICIWFDFSCCTPYGLL